MNTDTVEETCLTCKITFWITDGHRDVLRRMKTQFFCPNGHTQVYTGKSDALIIREKDAEIARLTELLAAKKRK